MSIDWTRFIEIVNTNESFLLTSHMKPDCDSLGSELAMAGILKSLGKKVRIVNGDSIPPHLTFIDPSQQIEQLGQGVATADLRDVDVVMVLDTSAWVQLGPMDKLVRTTDAIKVVVDHHVSEDDLGAVSFKETSAPAAGCLVYEAAQALGVALTPQIAEPLFAAIATDTGWFRFSSVSGDTYRLAGDLIDLGVVPQRLYSQLYEQASLSRVLLHGRILAQVQVELAGRLAYTQATLDDFEIAKAQASDTEDVINMLLRVAGTEVAVLFVQNSQDQVKASFRSRDGFNVRAIAEQFGGGGHTMAAGASVSGTLEEVKQRILDALRQAMK